MGGHDDEAGAAMIGHGSMIATLPADVRGLLRGRHTDPRLRLLASRIVEDGGDTCPPSEMAAAIDRWAELGFPEPEQGALHCPLCGNLCDEPGAPTRDTDLCEPVPEQQGSGGFSCRECDVTFGSSWLTDAGRVLQCRGRGTVPGMG
jgi:hypothetical protein